MGDLSLFPQKVLCSLGQIFTISLYISFDRLICYNGSFDAPLTVIRGFRK